MLFTDKLHDRPVSRNMRLLLHISVDQEAESKGNVTFLWHFVQARSLLLWYHLCSGWAFSPQLVLSGNVFTQTLRGIFSPWLYIQLSC